MDVKAVVTQDGRELVNPDRHNYKDPIDIRDHGISQGFVVQIEGGKRDGTVTVLAKIAAALRIRIEDPLTG